MTIACTSVNLQIAVLEQHIYGMTDIGRGVTKEGLVYHIYLIPAVQYHLLGVHSVLPQLF